MKIRQRIYLTDVQSKLLCIHPLAANVVSNVFTYPVLSMVLYEMLKTYNQPWDVSYETRLEQFWSSNRLCIIGVEENNIICKAYGFLVVGPDSDILYMEFPPLLRRKGLGTRVIEALKQYGYVQVDSPTEVVPFWEKLGFSRVPEIKRPKLNVVTMSWGTGGGGEEEEEGDSPPSLLVTSSSSNRIGTEIWDVD
jgi:GNAT superfamily N-acetyltransferase